MANEDEQNEETPPWIARALSAAYSFVAAIYLVLGTFVLILLTIPSGGLTLVALLVGLRLVTRRPLVSITVLGTGTIFLAAVTQPGWWRGTVPERVSPITVLCSVHWLLLIVCRALHVPNALLDGRGLPIRAAPEA